MYTEEDVEKLVNDEAHVQYAHNFKGQLQYYCIPPKALANILNQVYLKTYSDAFEQADAQNYPEE